MTMGRTAVRCPAVVALYFVCMGLYPILGLEVESLTAKGEVGGIATLNCTVLPKEAEILWLFNDKPLQNDRLKAEKEVVQLSSKDNEGTQLQANVSKLTITNVTSEDAGNYTCMAIMGDKNLSKVEHLNLYFEPKFIEANGPFSANKTANKEITMECIFEVYNVTNFKWYKKDSDTTYDKNNTKQNINQRRIKISHFTTIKTNDDNGTYICEVEDGVNKKQGFVDVLVYDQPKIIDDHALAISTSEIYLNWTLLPYNSKVEDINIYIFYRMRKAINDPFAFGDTRKIKNSSMVLSALARNTTYEIFFGVGGKLFPEYRTDHKKHHVTTLASDPVFVPNITINGFSATSVTIGWAPPPPEIEQYIHYYLLEAKKKDENDSSEAYHTRDGRNLPYMFDNLEPHSTYVFRVRACSDYGERRCGNWSEKMEAATLDGIPSKPTNVIIKCSNNMIMLNWSEPAQPKAEIKGYTMELTGNASFIDRYGQYKEVTWGPLSKFTKSESRSDRFDELQANTNYTVRLSAMTRTRRRGEEQVTSCFMPPAPPDHPPRPRWRKIFENNKYMFKMYLPRISERNGEICCYRVYMVRMLPQMEWKNLSEPQSMPVLDYRRVHADPPVLAAYITDIFSNNKFPSDSELVMGDNSSLYDASEKELNTSACRRCLEKPVLEDIMTTTIITSSTSTSTTTTPSDVDDGLDDNDNYTDDPVELTTTTPKPKRRRRSFNSDNYGDHEIMHNDKTELKNPVKDSVYDGPLDANAKYTLFVELIPGISSEPPLYSNYVNVLQAAPTPAAPQPASTLEIALQVTCAVAALILLLMIVFCIRQSRRTRKLPPHPHFEMNNNPIHRYFRIFSGRGGRQQMVATVPPDMPPIAKEDLPEAYAERQVDSDYGFQKEFEWINTLQYNAERVPKTTKLLQMLPECFPDRTTHASEARENQPKNRYPDIKAYDQTRVKLSQIDSITGSDYINANFVRGYQDRKQFICAQGPTDTTVNDFWRMIWEHGLELIVMLTNLEEYSKVKCSKYWPDEIRGSRAFGGITVHHVAEKRYSDYIVRELRITKQATNSDGQPIVENNGVAKRNGDIKEASEGSVPTSPREVKEDTRTVRQYHFLMWKDFAAPEHAYSILKFIKRVNEAWSSTLSRPCVVHCSAGVGRTGTLVALDCLLQQLREEGHAAVFNTVAELRTQRNFLVQSLKQYVFVYRALVEYTVYGDTEIPAHRLKAAVDKLRNTPPNAAHCLMEIEFQKIVNNPIPEPVKSCAAGAAEELRNKNRSQDVLPYDRNRVILAPIPTRDFSTYINASFIEAYDNSEGFIITQDPLPNTIMDFWRMVSEHNVTTIVMLSELSEGKCPRYWEDSLAQHEHIGVQYEESESCPYYTRRQFRVMNNKSGVSSGVRQLQYQGWPTAAGHVPEVTRGLAELADAANTAQGGTMLVHCQLGTERSSLFVALCILISQLRAERRVDVCSLTRKVRSQRARTIDTFLHYEFLHRAILNYAELHNLLEDS